MENVAINPKDYRDEYINNLNKCFKNWGGHEEYNWIFQRTVGDKTPDIIVISDPNNEIIAGSGVTYRKLKVANQKTIDIGIMTGSWTLPQARGKGCFSKMIEVSKHICNQNDVAYLTAFVMESNPSYRRLKEAGSFLIPTYHYFSNETVYPNTSKVVAVDGQPKIYSEIYTKLTKSQQTNLNFNYTLEEFIAQYINRIKKIEILKIGDDYSIIEETESVIKVHLITYDNLSLFEYNVTSLANWGLENKSKKLLLFSTKKNEAEVLHKLKYDNSPGFFTVLSTCQNAKPNTDIFKQIAINMGDKI